MESAEPRIRRAQIKDIKALSKLIYQTEEHPDDIWGGETEEECLEILQELFVTEESRYNLKYITVAEKENELLGAIILIPYDELDALSIKTDLKIINHYDSLKDKLLFILDSLKYMVFRECRMGNLYIANVATSKNARGLGVGKLLMSYAEQTAKTKHFRGLSLVAKNEAVSKFYEKLNYEKVFDRSLLGDRMIKMAKAF